MLYKFVHLAHHFQPQSWGIYETDAAVNVTVSNLPFLPFYLIVFAATL
jgi:hypothetical protein